MFGQKGAYVPCTVITFEGQITFLKLPTYVDTETENGRGKLFPSTREVPW